MHEYELVIRLISDEEIEALNMLQKVKNCIKSDNVKIKFTELGKIERMMRMGKL